MSSTLLQASDTPVAHENVTLLENFDDLAILFHPLTGEAIGINQTGIAIWKAIDGAHSLAEIAASLAENCEEAPTSALEDTLAFVSDLHRRLFVLLEPGD